MVHYGWLMLQVYLTNIYITSFLKKDSVFNTKGKSQNTFNASKQHPINSKAMLKHYFQHRSSDLHLKVEGMG